MKFVERLHQQVDATKAILANAPTAARQTLANASNHITQENVGTVAFGLGVAIGAATMVMLISPRADAAQYLVPAIASAALMWAGNKLNPEASNNLTQVPVTFNRRSTKDNLPGAAQ